jgi:hypothetical protein
VDCSNLFQSILLKNTLGKKNDWISFEHKLDRFNDLKIGEVNFSGLTFSKPNQGLN